jgi:hypothetical protein
MITRKSGDWFYSDLSLVLGVPAQSQLSPIRSAAADWLAAFSHLMASRSIKVVIRPCGSDQGIGTARAMRWAIRGWSPEGFSAGEGGLIRRWFRMQHGEVAVRRG